MSKQYEATDYAIEVKRLDEDLGGGFEAVFPQFARSVVGFGATPQQAIDDLIGAFPSFVEAVSETGQSISDPASGKSREGFSGKFNVRVPKLLHSKLVRVADDQGVSLNSLVQTILMSGVTATEAGMEFGPTIPARAPGNLKSKI